jgi:hypothetical protein
MPDLVSNPDDPSLNDSGGSQKIIPVLMRLSGVMAASAPSQGRWIKDTGVLSPIAL